VSGHQRAFACVALAAVLGACAAHPSGQLLRLANQTAAYGHGDSTAAAEGVGAKNYNGSSTRIDAQDSDQWPAPVHDDQSFTFLRAEQLEFRVRDGGPDVARWEAQGWHGGDYQRLWIKTEGEQTVEGAAEGDLEVQALYSQLVAPFWDFQVGARYDSRFGAGSDIDRWFGVVGVQGLSPYEFEVEAALFISEDADVSARLTASTDFLITQRLILQPRFEAEIAVQEVAAFEVGQGLNYVELGLRLRYEFQREIAPYIGINWTKSTGETADLVSRGGGDASDLSLVAGISLWF
tara:strand:- start:28536 stop:29414 length:879 start_codon:yes stop_codon:yes gene_type:complete